jgi:hypothetical protein
MEAAKMTIKSMFVLIIAIGFALTFAACDEDRESRTETRIVEAGGAEAVEVDVRMGAGELRLHGGASALMEGRFETNHPRWIPEVDYRIRDRKGELTVRQRRSTGIHLGHRRNEWTISLNGGLTTGLKVHLGAGESRLDLRGMALESLDIQMGVGELDLDLGGPRTKALRARIEGGVGSGTIRLPRDIGVRIEVNGGIGSVDAHGFEKKGHTYTNEAYGRTPASIDMQIDAGIGSIDLRLE